MSPHRALLLVVFLGLASAATAAEPPRDDATLGRLFLTPDQRRLLDIRRAQPVLNAEGLPADLLPGRRSPSQRLVMNGLVRRGREAPVVWVNGRRADGAGQAEARASGPPDRDYRVRVDAGGAAKRLKPGQVWDLGTGRVSECLRCDEPAAPGVREPAAAVIPVPTTAQATP